MRRTGRLPGHCEPPNQLRSWSIGNPQLIRLGAERKVRTALRQLRGKIIVDLPSGSAEILPKGDEFPTVGTTARRDAVWTADGGLVAFGGGSSDVRLSWVDRSGREQQTPRGLGPLKNLVLFPRRAPGARRFFWA